VPYPGQIAITSKGVLPNRQEGCNAPVFLGKKNGSREFPVILKHILCLKAQIFAGK